MPDIITFNRIAEILGVDLNYFSESFKSETTENASLESVVKQTDKLPSGKHSDNYQEKKLSWDMSRGNWVDADFSGSNISNSHIQNSNLGNNNFGECSLKETEFSGSNIGGCDFSRTDFTGATFKHSNFSKNSMEDALWNRTTFIGTALDELTFVGALEDCYFENCAFYKVTFRNAILTNTFFKNKSLKRIRFIVCQADRMTYEFLKAGKADLTGITLLTP
jgi:uncharacterized protein YjbI with pentapeptide repeats